MAGLMKEQQRRIDNLNGWIIRLETALELALNRSSPQSFRLLEAGLGGGTSNLVPFNWQVLCLGNR